MTVMMSPSVGALPQAALQPMSLHQVLAGGANLGSDSITGAAGMPDLGVPTGVAGVLGGGAAPTGAAAQAVQGVGAANEQQLAEALRQVITATNALISALEARGVTGGGGAGGAVGQCGMAGCTMDHSSMAPQGANGGVRAAGAPTQAGPDGHAHAHAHGERAGAEPASGRRAAASRSASGAVKDKSSTAGLSAAAKRGLEEAHRFDLPLVSGKRAGSAGSDHNHGDAIDVGTLAIGAAASSGATPAMREYAEHMRAEGKAGRLNVKYIIMDGKIASATNDWAWRPYTYPGKSAETLAALKASNRGEYNRLQHYDHVHISFT